MTEETCISLSITVQLMGSFDFTCCTNHFSQVAPRTCFGTSVARERADILTLLFLLNRRKKREPTSRLIQINMGYVLLDAKR